MSKQDRQGVRTPSDIERKYDLSALNKVGNESEKISQLSQTVSQFVSDTNKSMDELQVTSEAQSEAIENLSGAFAQLETDTGNAINTLTEQLNEVLLALYPVGAVYISVNSTEPSTLFGGTWEAMSQGYLVVGMDQESENEATELQFLDSCYIWKRTS